MLFITFHGGKPTQKVPDPINNVYAYDETTTPPTCYQEVLSAGSLPLSELRGLFFAAGYLYVANGAKSTSNVFCFQQSSATTNPSFNYVETFVDESVNSISHPFGIAFDYWNNAYVSNQDSNVVTQLTVSNNFQTGTAVTGNAASYLTQFIQSGEAYLNGTFVASHDPAPGFPGTPHVPDSQGGLDFSPKTGKISHSVRDVVLCIGLVCVADEAASVVKVYDPFSGTFYCASNALSAGPIHLYALGITLYVAAGSIIYAGTPTQTNNAWTLTLAPLTLNPALPDEASGMCFDEASNFYVAVRKKNSIWRYDSNFANGAEFISGLQDNPEFVVWQPNPSPAAA